MKRSIKQDRVKRQPRYDGVINDKLKALKKKPYRERKGQAIKHVPL